MRRLKPGKRPLYKDETRYEPENDPDEQRRLRALEQAEKAKKTPKQ